MSDASHAAIYVRMSTEHQQYSTENQADVIREYLKTLLQNARVSKYLGQKHGDLLDQIRRVVDASSLEG